MTDLTLKVHLIRGVGHVGFGTFLRAIRVGQLHMEQVEYKTVQCRAQTVTEAPDSCDHPLDHTYTEQINVCEFTQNRG